MITSECNMQVENLSYKHHKASTYFFQELSFALEPGKIHALQGKNGVGKSVLLNLLCGKQPSQAVVTGKLSCVKETAYVNQRFDQMIADQFSFQENLQFACMMAYPALFSRLKQPKIDRELLERFSIDPFKPVKLLSGGQRQILALLMVLQKPFTCLLLDEPTATLDEQNAEMVFAFLHELVSQQVTLLMVCHDKELMQRHTTGRLLTLHKEESGIRRLL